MSDGATTFKPVARDADGNATQEKSLKNTRPPRRGAWTASPSPGYSISVASDSAGSLRVVFGRRRAARFASRMQEHYNAHETATPVSSGVSPKVSRRISMCNAQKYVYCTSGFLETSTNRDRLVNQPSTGWLT